MCVILAAGAYLIYKAENDHLQYQTAAAMFFAFASLLAIPFLFIRNIVEPLEEVLSAARKITEGYLKETVPIRNKDEIGKIGEQINALSVNLQEILLHVWNHSRDSADILKRISDNNRGIPSDMAQDIAAVRHSMEEMQSMVKTFEYYDIRMDEDRLMSEEDPNRREKEKIS
jgi:methyl-accepting chemotaxis protein